MKRIPIWLILCVIGLALAGAQPGGAQTAEWTLKVSVEGAQVRIKPDAAAAAAASLPKGTVLKSAAREGGWFRVVVEAGREGVVVIGYISAGDVEVTQKPAEEPDLWAEATEEYRGAGINVRVGGGFLWFGSGDISGGALGEFDRIVATLEAAGTSVHHVERVPVDSGSDFTADIFYGLNRRWGVGIRFDYLHSYRISSARFNIGNNSKDFTLDTNPLIDAYVLRPGVYYELPLNRWLKFQANGGPSLYSVKYEFTRGFIVPDREDDLHYKVNANRLGVQGGIGLELQLNKRSGFYVEVQGRYARITSLKGTEWGYTWENYQVVNTEVEGYLHYGEKAGYPDLFVSEEESASGESAPRAVLDLSGVSVAAGIRIRF